MVSLSGFPKVSNVTTWVNLVLVLVSMVSLCMMRTKIVHVVICLFGDKRSDVDISVYLWVRAY